MHQVISGNIPDHKWVLKAQFITNKNIVSHKTRMQ